MGLSKTRRGARQVVNHGHILVNGKKVNIPSYLVQPGDVISVKEASKEHKAIKESLEAINNTVAYVNFDKAKMEGTFVRYPERSELSAEINEPLIVEYYSR
jgi:small subunit ribosomal protein S4